MDLEKIASDAVSGDEDAFVMLMKAYKTDLYRTAYAYLKNEQDAIEAVQETTYRAYKSIQTLKQPVYAKTWMIRIMINVCQTELKKKKRMVPHLTEENGIASDDNASFIETAEALDSLEPEERELVHMKYFQDMTITQVAHALNMPEGTVKTKLYKSLSRLKRWFEKGEHTRVSK
ncbi:sigma-70 family RNA polymerase sigma factor [Jeotgalibacillus haloalkalitolerans]|uniref:Sigma-70 family RNA polymerase sigma factor n=1 Tax=Jeotgalibacillus haloalkalitolerans TaxID=3104292 RepID=A0ABU5KRU4_9BACL|nr:sigma-70 family RNA polymerase sigma factor [Jeotgalibacillus sp. HH7-29]MDZ5713445.1 sigma-70 family RNA polymerase sigma factor [Jeotgalibacillus sp. HH7-29]